MSCQVDSGWTAPGLNPDDSSAENPLRMTLKVVRLMFRQWQFLRGMGDGGSRQQGNNDQQHDREETYGLFMVDGVPSCRGISWVNSISLESSRVPASQCWVSRFLFQCSSIFEGDAALYIKRGFGVRSTSARLKSQRERRAFVIYEASGFQWSLQGFVRYDSGLLLF
jgi:hypothetical protein